VSEWTRERCSSTCPTNCDGCGPWHRKWSEADDRAMGQGFAVNADLQAEHDRAIHRAWKHARKAECAVAPVRAAPKPRAPVVDVRAACDASRECMFWVLPT